MFSSTSSPSCCCCCLVLKIQKMLCLLLLIGISVGEAWQQLPYQQILRIRKTPIRTILNHHHRHHQQRHASHLSARQERRGNSDADAIFPSSPPPTLSRRALVFGGAFTSSAVATAASAGAKPAYALGVMSGAPTISPSSMSIDEYTAALEQVGKGWSSPQESEKVTSKWPDSPSPLPTTKKSAQELTQPDNNAMGSQQSDLQNALEKAAKKKRVDPRTHG